jgi:hypothetical protein
LSAGDNLVVAEDGLTVEYVIDESTLSPSKPAVVKTSTPIRRIGEETLFYFEITVLEQGLKGYGSFHRALVCAESSASAAAAGSCV